MKLYADEAEHQEVRSLSILAISNLARVEVPAAVWRKHRIGELDAGKARVLTDQFEADFFGVGDTPSHFVVMDVTEDILESAARLVAIHPFRAFDAVQLASALAAQKADPNCTDFACFDTTVRAAAAAEGLVVFPDA